MSLLWSELLSRPSTATLLLLLSVVVLMHSLTCPLPPAPAWHSALTPSAAAAASGMLPDVLLELYTDCLSSARWNTDLLPLRPTFLERLNTNRIAIFLRKHEPFIHRVLTYQQVDWVLVISNDGHSTPLETTISLLSLDLVASFLSHGVSDSPHIRLVYIVWTPNQGHLYISFPAPTYIPYCLRKPVNANRYNKEVHGQHANFQSYLLDSFE